MQTTVPIRVLIADDSELMRRQIRTTLEPERDIEICAEAENGLEAVRRALQCRPDLVVVDVNMPVMNGLAATEDIKMLMPSVPVLVFTLSDSHQIRIETERAGAEALTHSCSKRTQVSSLPGLYRPSANGNWRRRFAV
jgi:DNA-binding NarL/FixJ family response regulator